MQDHHTIDHSLDPRRGSRTSLRHHRGLVSATIAVPRIHELVTLLFVRLGLVR